MSIIVRYPLILKNTLNIILCYLRYYDRIWEIIFSYKRHRQIVTDFNILNIIFVVDTIRHIFFIGRNIII